MPRTAIFIPAYQAELTLASVFERIPEAFWPEVERVFVINDGSTDGTDQTARDLADKYPRVEVATQAENRGYGAAVRKGLKLCLESGADYVVCLHADGQYPPEKLPEFVPYMAKHGIDVLQGSRHKDGTARAGGMPMYKVIAGHTLTALENWTFGLRMTDYHSGFMLYSRRAVETIPFDELSTYFDFDLEVIASARARGLVVDELGIPTHYGDEESHLNPIWYGLRCLRVMLKYRLGRYA
ncbi:MAG: glycosyltransferase family 2 protein [Myxococcota bacterium]|nr:glycosyltransferase family 2 protein [Myxococcota bacterium]